MLNREKLLFQLASLRPDDFGFNQSEKQRALKLWNDVQHDPELSEILQSKKWSLLIPKWTGLLGQVVAIEPQNHPYQVLAVDGSQIYYDKHQGPPCFLINIGTVFFSYELKTSTVQFFSEPIVVLAAQSCSAISTQSINLQREQAELAVAVDQLIKIKNKQLEKVPLVCFFDGTLIFSHTEGLDDQKDQVFAQYVQHWDMLHKHKILHAGYISFPKSKELVNVLKLVQVSFVEKLLDQSDSLDRLTDMDIAQFFLRPNQRTIVFESKVFLSYLYPKDLKPYFCYLNVGAEMVRLEFPAWIAKDETLVNQVCAIALDQAQKGAGYPVCLFEAHEQAVVKNYDREFFYHMIQKMTQQHAGIYQVSSKSMKKSSVPV